MAFEEYINKFSSGPELVYASIGAAVLVLLLVILVIYFIRKNTGKHSIPNIIKEIGNDYLKDVALPDGIDGYVFVDYLVLTPTGILVVNVEDYNGFLFGADSIDEWTQMIGHKSYKFKNPLPQHQHNIQSVKSHTGDVPVKGRLVFTSEGSFPKGIPQGVSTAESFKDDVSTVVVGNAIPEIFQQIWKELMAKSREAAQQLAKHK